MAKKPFVFTDEYIDYLIHLKNENDKSWEEMAIEFNIRFSANIKGRTLSNKWFNLTKNGEVTNSTSSQLHTDKVLYNAATNQLDKYKKALEKEKIRTQQIVEACLGALSKFNFKPIKPPKLPKRKKLDMEMHLLRSDSQVGEDVSPTVTSGLGSYNFDIYVKRLDRLLERTVKFWEQDKTSLGLRKLVSPQLGDHVEGENIYKGQAYYLDRPLIDQVFDSLDVEVNRFWLPLAELFEEIELYCVYGNHGRTGRKGQFHIRTNWDYVYYKVLKSALEISAPHIKVFISESPIMLVDHGEYTFCYKHGDDVNSWMGVPYYGLNRIEGKTSHMFNELIDYFCVGHFHAPANLNDRTLINGTMVGGSMLSINKMASNSVPSQKLFYFHPRHGINRESNLYLDNKIKLEKDKNGIYTPIAK